MANYATNHLILFDNPEKIKKIVDDIWIMADLINPLIEGFRFDKITPIPPKEQRSFFDPEEWFCNNWGTNSEPVECWYKIFNNYSVFGFETTWDGVFPLMETLSRKYKVEVYYDYRLEGGAWGILYYDGKTFVTVSSDDYLIEPESIINFSKIISSEKLEITKNFFLDKTIPIYSNCDSMIKQNYPKFPDMTKNILNDLVKLEENW